MTDNAASYKSQLTQEYLKSTGGDVALMYLLPCTPQMSPIETQWWMIKERPTGRYFATEDEMKCSIVMLVESGAVQPVRISGLPMA